MAGRARRFGARINDAVARAVRPRDGPQATVAQPPPSEELCEIALRLVQRLDEFERAGVGYTVDDVCGVSPYRELFAPDASSTDGERPYARWEIALSDNSAHERVVGEAGRGWSVSGLTAFAKTIDCPDVCHILVDERGHEMDIKPPTVSMSEGPDYFAFIDLVLLIWRPNRLRPPSWHDDPSGFHTFRFWDGSRWTRFVVDRDTIA